MSILDERGNTSRDTSRGTRAADADPVGEMFASSTVLVHVLRGVLGLALIVAGLALAGRSAWALLLVVPGVIAWRGCPTCWTLGLIATVSRGRVSASCPR